MRVHISKARAQELRLPIPDGAPSIIEYEVAPAADGTPCCEGCKRVAKWDKGAAEALQKELVQIRATLGLEDPEKTADGVRRFLAAFQENENFRIEGHKRLQAQLDSEQALRKQLEKELEDALAKLTEPTPAPAPPTPTEPEIPTPPAEESTDTAEPRRKRARA